MTLMYGCGEISLGIRTVWEFLHHCTLSSEFENSVWWVAELTAASFSRIIAKKLQLSYTTGETGRKGK